MAAARTCGCTARSAAVADWSGIPGFILSRMFIQGISSLNAMLGRICGSVLIGKIMSNGRPTSTPRKPGGVTPTIVTGMRSTITVAPTLPTAPRADTS